MTLLKKVHLCLHIVVQFNVAAQLHNRFNLIDFVRRYITFCNALTDAQ